MTMGKQKLLCEENLRHAYLQEVKAGGAFGEDLRRDRKKYHLPEA